jgi:hypothetical protein
VRPSICGCAGGDEQIALRVNSDTQRKVELGGGTWPTISAEASDAVSCYSADNAAGADPPDAMVEVVSNEQIPDTIQRDTRRIVKPSGGSEATVAAETKLPATCHRGDDPSRIDFADAIVGCVGYEQIALDIDRQAPRLAEVGAVAGPPSPLKPHSSKKPFPMNGPATPATVVMTRR